MEILSTSHPSILKFYIEHPHIDFESVNILFVQLLERIFDNNDNIQKSSADKMLNSINDLFKQFDTFKTTQELKDKSFQDQMNLHVNNMKLENIQEIEKLIKNSNEQSSHEFKSSFATIIEKQNTQIQKDIQLMLHEQFPKNNDLIISLQPMLEKFQQTNKELILSMDSSSSKTTIDSYMERLSVNYNNLINNYQTNVISKIDLLHNSTSSFQEFINKYQNSSLKGQFGENKLSSVLNECFPVGEIINTSGTKHSCDYLLKREKMKDIYFENKDYESNIPPKEIKKFIRDIEEQDSHGIFLSQSSGITSKPNFHIDIHKNNVLVYLHHVNFDSVKIKTAVDIIDHLSSRIETVNTDNNNHENIISQEELEIINQEYIRFISHKDNLIQLTRDYQKKLSAQINELELPNIEKYLNSKFANIKNSDFLCNICGKFRGTSAKSLAAHQRSCKIKNHCIPVIETESMEEMNEN